MLPSVTFEQKCISVSRPKDKCKRQLRSVGGPVTSGRVSGNCHADRLSLCLLYLTPPLHHPSPLRFPLLLPSNFSLISVMILFLLRAP